MLAISDHAYLSSKNSHGLNNATGPVHLENSYPILAPGDESALTGILCFDIFFDVVFQEFDHFFVMIIHCLIAPLLCFGNARH